MNNAVRLEEERSITPEACTRTRPGALKGLLREIAQDNVTFDNLLPESLRHRLTGSHGAGSANSRSKQFAIAERGGKLLLNENFIIGGIRQDLEAVEQQGAALPF